MFEVKLSSEEQYTRQPYDPLRILGLEQLILLCGPRNAPRRHGFLHP